MVGDNLKTEIIELNGEKIEIITDLPDDFFEYNEDFSSDFDNTLDLTEDIKLISNQEERDDYDH